MDSILLKTFLEVSKTRHFGKAADNLFITHSAVGFRIRHLEEIVGTPLFHRQRNNLSLTPEGERLIPYAEGIITSWSMALQDVGISKEQSVLITIGGTSNIWDTFLQSQLSGLTTAIADISIRTEVNNQIQLVQGVISGSIDIGLVFDPPKSTELSVEEISEFELVLVSSIPGLTLTSLDPVDFVMVDWGTAFNIQQAKILPKVTTPILRTGQTYIAREFLRSKKAYAYLTTELIQSDLLENRLFDVADAPKVTKVIYAIFKKDSAKSDHIEEVVSQLRDPVIKSLA
ncbi:MAG: LysR family transcriptional regulator [Motiliproteus sp.]|nr:LysR family transcriptional regulator [Motiliproteus sp.]MCW9052534.1 LysR family transcriptional regulator [Motiliproteus sp.]